MSLPRSSPGRLGEVAARSADAGGYAVGQSPLSCLRRPLLQLPGGAAMLTLLLLTACRAEPQASPFPPAGRDVAPIVSDAFSTEDARDRVGEFEAVVAAAEVRPGMSVADIGAGEGYYTVRLSPLVGVRGRVLAQDIVPEVRDRLAERVQRDRLDNVTVRLGLSADPKLPPASLDRIFPAHMHHEVTDPYAFLWHLVGGLKPGGGVVGRARCRRL